MNPNRNLWALFQWGPHKQTHTLTHSLSNIYRHKQCESGYERIRSAVLIRPLNHKQLETSEATIQRTAHRAPPTRKMTVFTPLWFLGWRRAVRAESTKSTGRVGINLRDSDTAESETNHNKQDSSGSVHPFNPLLSSSALSFSLSVTASSAFRVLLSLWGGSALFFLIFCQKWQKSSATVVDGQK